MVRLIIFLYTALLIVGCSSVDGMFQDSDNAPLKGERLSVLELQKDLEPENTSLSAQGFIAPKPWKNEYWPQSGGYPNHSMQHIALSEVDLRLAWKSRIGRGATDALPLTAHPIIVDNKVFTLDTKSRLTAINATNGDIIWKRSVDNPEEDDQVIGGGISYSGGNIYLTNGFREVFAINPKNGKALWRKQIPAPARGAPTSMDNRAFVTTLDNRILALNSLNGDLLWEYSGISETAGLIGAASPAADREIVVPVFSSGEIFALRVENGSVAWSDNLSSLRKSSGLSTLPDIRGLPVIDKGLVFAVSFSGRTVAIDSRTGSRVWQREIGGSETPWVAGNHVFLITSENELIALGRDNGVIQWVLKLPKNIHGDSNKEPITWFGPLFAGNRLITVSSIGNVYEINPNSGKLIKKWQIGYDIALSPVIANETLYLLSTDGILMAYN